MRRGDMPSMAARMRTRIRRAASVSLVLLVIVVACRSSASRVTGTWRLVRAGGSGCTLQVAPAGRDSVRVQLSCDRGPPSHNQGWVDTRLPIHGDRVVFETSEYRRRCVLTLDFASSRAIVAQEGDDADCGFGFGVSAAGTYERTSSDVPPFDLWPEGPSPQSGAG